VRLSFKPAHVACCCLSSSSSSSSSSRSTGSSSSCLVLQASFIPICFECAGLSFL
jgi:exo-beta-1,3-glucanase (GH17 family)